MAKGFLDKVLAFMGIQEETEEPDDEVLTAARREVAAASGPRPDGVRPQPQPPATDEARRPRLVSLPNQKQSPLSGLRVMVLEPRTFEEVQQVADHLKERRPVIVSLESVDRDLSKRIIDFVSGTTYALDGNVQRIGESIFLFTPSNVSIEGDLAEKWRDGGIFA